ncbi:GTP-binding protein [Actinopolymorpha sp. B9G3]|uniref:CobW family GTP-binding protein n=1 Tax=Actinopolymorpha sp. B9G3 TaxID=3158970 RepID=UPI0032D98187
MASPLPVTVVASMDDVLRRTAASAVLCDLPRSVVVQHDLHGLASDDALRRVVYDLDGVVENTAVPLEHACLSCALREDVVPTLVRLARSGRWDRLVLALPVTAEPDLVLSALHGAVVDGQSAASVVSPAGVLATVDLTSLVDDLFGDDLLVERGLAMTTDDRRAVGEVIAHQIECADIVASAGSPSPDSREATVVRHLAPTSAELADLHDLDVAKAMARAHGARGPHRGDYRRAELSGAGENNGVWTLDLASWRPVHPARLHDRIVDLAGGQQRSRGWFWLPTRPRAVCGWDSAGGQLSIGTVGRWSATSPQTRIVVTGIDDGRERLREAFDGVLMTDSELARGLSHWEERDDGFSQWLGEIDEAA